MPPERSSVSSTTFCGNIFLTYKPGFPIPTSKESKFLLKLKILNFASTMLSRGSQIHQAYLSEHISLFDGDYLQAARQSSQFLTQQGMDPVTAQQGGAGVIYNELLRQAYMLSFNDTFFILSIMTICLLPFILIMRHDDHNVAKP